jgi:hypothetical protein
VFTAPS